MPSNQDRLPVVVILGRPNVGKSTLFNRLTRTRDALVADAPGLTRDRIYGRCPLASRACLVVDTGGLTERRDGLQPLIAHQAEQALAEADVVLFVVDGRAGLTPGDASLADRLRRAPCPVFLVVNKTDGLDPEIAMGEFHGLGLGARPWPISASHGSGIHALVDGLEAALPAIAETPGPADQGTRIAVVGRPNVGKSTLVNRMLGEDRVLAYDRPGTTRDSVFIPLERHGHRYTLIDTAGVRRRARVTENVERFSIIKTLQAIEAAQVVILLIDAAEQVTDQDAHLLGHVQDVGRALVIAANKWDGLDTRQRAQVRDTLIRKLGFIDYAQVHYISALHGSGVGHLFEAADRAWASASRDLKATQLTRLLQEAVERHPPPAVRGRRIKLRYAHQGGHNPPVIVIHGNQTEAVPEAYRRYLAGRFRKALDLAGTPVRIELRTGENPFKGRHNPLTPRQRRRRQRVIRHARR